MLDRYDELYRSFRWNVPPRYNIARACCGQWAVDRSRFALYWEDESGATAAYSFWDIQVAANRLSNALAGLGVQRGDRVAIILPQRPETAIAYMAIFQMGAIALPLSHLFGPEALEYRINGRPRHAGPHGDILLQPALRAPQHNPCTRRDASRNRRAVQHGEQLHPIGLAQLIHHTQ